MKNQMEKKMENEMETSMRYVREKGQMPQKAMQGFEGTLRRAEKPTCNFCAA